MIAGTPSTAFWKSGASAVRAPPMIPPWLFESHKSRELSKIGCPPCWNAGADASPFGWSISRPKYSWSTNPCWSRSANFGNSDRSLSTSTAYGTLGTFMPVQSVAQYIALWRSAIRWMSLSLKTWRPVAEQAVPVLHVERTVRRRGR